MFKIFKISAFSILIYFLINACSSEIKLTKYYILTEAVPQGEADFSDTTQNRMLPYNVVIDNFKVAEAYNLNRIAIRTQSNELHYYYYHNWAEPPSHAVPYFIWKHLKKRNVFKNCNLIGTPFQTDYEIEGTIHQIERTALNNNYHAHLQMELELIDYKTNQTVLRHFINERLPLKESSSMNTFAAKISRILAEQTDIFIEKIYAKVN